MDGTILGMRLSCTGNVAKLYKDDMGTRLWWPGNEAWYLGFSEPVQ